MSVPETFMRTMPHDLEAERAVLGALLLDVRHVDYALQQLPPEAFYHQPHRLVFEAVHGLYEQNQAIDILTLRSEMERRQALEAAGGLSYLASLTDGVARTTNVQHYARIVKEKYLLRQLLWASSEISQACLRQETTPQEILDQAERKVFEIAEGYIRPDYVHVGTLVDEVLELAQERARTKSTFTGVPTGFADLDRLTGGFQKGNLVIVAARPSVGKSTFCMNVAVSAALGHGKTVGVFSLEDSREHVVRRMMCSVARINSRDVDMGSLRREDWTRLAQAKAELVKAPIYVDDMPATILDIKTKARRLKAEAGGLDLVVVDYLQLLQSASGINTDNRAREVAIYTQAMKNLAKELEIPVVVASQLNRGTEMRPDPRPRLADLRESGAIEQDADVVIFLVRPDMYKTRKQREEESQGAAPDPNAPVLTELHIAKHRNGPTAEIKMVFFPAYTRFSDASVEGGAMRVS
jgi:replicative DNA helicase